MVVGFTTTYVISTYHHYSRYRSFGMTTVLIWKKACINLFITYFNIELKRTKLTSHTKTHTKLWVIDIGWGMITVLIWKKACIVLFIKRLDIMLFHVGALKSDSTHHFFRNACTKSGSLRFSQFSGCWLILSVYIIMSFDFPFVRLFGVR